MRSPGHRARDGAHRHQQRRAGRPGVVEGRLDQEGEGAAGEGRPPRRGHAGSVLPFDARRGRCSLEPSSGIVARQVPTFPSRQVRRRADDPKRMEIRSLEDLLEALQVDDLEMLVDLVVDETLPSAFLAGSDPTMIAIGIGRLATELRYPFSLEDFWEVVDDLEREHRAEIEEED